MYDTMLVQLTDQRAVGLLHELEVLEFIKVMKPSAPSTRSQRLSDKYRGIMSEKERMQLHSHTQQMRNEWQAT